MRVIYTHLDRWASQSSGPTFVTFTAWALASQGVDTHLVVWNQSEGATDEILRESFGIDSVPATLHIERISAGSRRQFFAAAKRYALQHAASQTVMYSSSAYFLRHMRAVQRKSGCATVYEAQDFHLDLSQRDDLRGSHRRKSFWERRCLPSFSGVVCVSEAQASLYRQHLPDNVPVAVMRNGIYRIAENSGIPEANDLAYVGSLGWRKGVDRLTGLAGALPAERRLHIFGGRAKDDLKALEDRFRQSGGWEQLTIHPWMTPRELHQQLASIRWGLIPLHDTFFNRNITSPTKLLDSYAQGAPVLATDLPTVRELVEHGRTGFLVDWNDGRSIAELTTLSDERYREMQAAVREKARELTWDRRAERLVNFFEARLAAA